MEMSETSSMGTNFLPQHFTIKDQGVKIEKLSESKLKLIRDGQPRRLVIWPEFEYDEGR